MSEYLKNKIGPIYFLREPILRYSILAGLLIALYAPENILDQLPVLKPFTQLMSTIFPPIEYYALKSKFPQVSELYFSLMWVFSPLHFYYLNADFRAQRFEWARKWKRIEFDVPYHGFKQYANRIFITVFLMPVLIIVGLFYNKGYDFNLLPINSSRTALGLFGFWFAGAGSFALLLYEYHQLRKLSSEIKSKFARGG